MYGEAIDYDLMTRTGLTLRDWERGDVDSRTLIRFVRGLGTDSALFRKANPEKATEAAWLDGTAACALLAELIDAVRESACVLAYKGTGKRPPRFEPMPRPWTKERKAQSYGKDPIPISDFEKWYYGGSDD